MTLSFVAPGKSALTDVNKRFGGEDICYLSRTHARGKIDVPGVSVWQQQQQQLLLRADAPARVDMRSELADSASLKHGSVELTAGGSSPLESPRRSSSSAVFLIKRVLVPVNALFHSPLPTSVFPPVVVEGEHLRAAQSKHDTRNGLRFPFQYS